MIKADVKIAEQRQIVEVPVETKSEAIRVLWNTYGLGIDIKRWIEEEKDEQTDSNESDDSGEPSGKGD
ncbi:hypothetical protein KJR23_06785 [Streptococcus lutetiensis]|uniref:hypothetical protein n=1 Tax=Streptococcus lutetiensis TaxID=150055 RepID=UPI001BDB011C|nr:hypothetical protein [Streptococcus lutetiensis]MBT0891714.1 hypothetical protein [Streptococcus lutetiensis]MBT0901336.1 hypothetical protein [Streptococcus lutetiensis]HEP3614025.1 hypothetical protein [Streptococcus pyogenes]